jgi:hypothetical protein
MSSAPTAARAATLAALALILSSSSCCACADQTRKYTIQNLKIIGSLLILLCSSGNYEILASSGFAGF